MYRIKKMTAAFSAVLFLVGALIYGMTSAYAESELIPETDCTKGGPGGYFFDPGALENCASADRNLYGSDCH